MENKETKEVENNEEMLKDRIAGCLYGALIGDALSMPVHWYYNPKDIVNDFGQITDFQPPKNYHPSSIMHVSNTGGHGRGSNTGTIIGDVILHGKKKFWGPPGIHYHQGMQGGENTLNALCLRLLVRSITNNNGVYDADKFLDDYIKFMTTPNTHNDTYAESFHRDFFVNWSKGLPARKCSGAEGHNTASVGGFVMLPATIATNFNDKEKAVQQTIEHLALTHTSSTLAKYAQFYTIGLWEIINGKKNAQDVAKEWNEELKLGLGQYWKRGNAIADTDVIGGAYSSACYIDGSFACMTYLLGKYNNSIEDALIANTNSGGENAHRGAALGALMGASVGAKNIPKRWLNGLAARKDISEEINALLTVLFPSKPSAQAVPSASSSSSTPLAETTDNKPSDPTDLQKDIDTKL